MILKNLVPVTIFEWTFEWNQKWWSLTILDRPQSFLSINYWCERMETDNTTKIKQNLLKKFGFRDYLKFNRLMPWAHRTILVSLNRDCSHTIQLYMFSLKSLFNLRFIIAQSFLIHVNLVFPLSDWSVYRVKTFFHRKTENFMLLCCNYKISPPFVRCLNSTFVL